MVGTPPLPVNDLKLDIERRSTVRRRIDRRPFYAAEETVGFLMWDTMRRFVREFSRRIERHGVSFGHWPFLRVLWEEDGLTQRELAKRAGMSAPTALAVLEALERKGLARRQPDPRDRRKQNVYLTPKGRRVYPKVVPEVRAVNLRAMRGLDAAERERLKTLLRHLRTNIASASDNARSKRAPKRPSS